MFSLRSISSKLALLLGLIFAATLPSVAQINPNEIAWDPTTCTAGQVWEPSSLICIPNGSTGPTANQNLRSIGAVFDGGGVALAGTITRCAPVNFAGTIQGVTLISDVSGSVTIDVQTVVYSSYTGPSSASTITASATPALSSAVKYQDTTLTGWTTTLAANTMVCFKLSSPSTLTWAAISVKVAAN